VPLELPVKNRRSDDIMQGANILSEDGWMRFIPLLNLMVIGSLCLLWLKGLNVPPLPKSTGYGVIHHAGHVILQLPFAMSSVMLQAFMLIMLCVSMVNVYRCGGVKWLLGLTVVLWSLICLFNAYENSEVLTTFPNMPLGIYALLNVSNLLVIIMLIVLAVSLSLLLDSRLRNDSGLLKSRVRMFKVQMYMACLLLLVGLLEIFLLYDWQFGTAAAKAVVLAAGIIYSGVMVTLFLPTAWLLHRSAELMRELSQTRRCSRRFGRVIETSDINRRIETDMSRLSPIAGMGTYIATFLPALLGVLPSLVGP